MDQKQNNNQNGQIRRYNKRGKVSDTAKGVSIIVMIAIIALGIIVYIMSLTGTGLFRESSGKGKDSDVVDTKGDETKSSEETESPTGVTYKYIDKTAEDSAAGELILLDAKHPYRGEEPSLDSIASHDIANAFSLRTNAQMLNGKVIDILITMTTELRNATGYKYVYLPDSYRSYEDQERLYNSNPGAAAKPGCSDYHTGMSVSLAGYGNGQAVSFWGVEAGQWTKENAHKYGFIFRYPTNKKTITGFDNAEQIRYVGIPHATYMYENDLCLEEYLEKLAGYKFGGEHLMVNGADGNAYEIFYVMSSDDGKAKLPVPSNRDYTVSGDNKGGFIVTIDLGKQTSEN